VVGACGWGFGFSALRSRFGGFDGGNLCFGGEAVGLDPFQ